RSSPAGIGTVKIDAVAPGLSGAPTTQPNANGWYNNAVIIHWTCTDNGGGSGINQCPTDKMISQHGTGQTTSATVADIAGNTTTASSSPAVNIDLLPPSISLSVPKTG